MKGSTDKGRMRNWTPLLFSLTRSLAAAQTDASPLQWLGRDGSRPRYRPALCVSLPLSLPPSSSIQQNNSIMACSQTFSLAALSIPEMSMHSMNTLPIAATHTTCKLTHSGDTRYLQFWFNKLGHDDRCLRRLKATTYTTVSCQSNGLFPTIQKEENSNYCF